MTVVAVGKSSFLAGHVLRDNKDWLALSHGEALADTSWAERASCVVNFGFDPQGDFDSLLAAVIAYRPVHYIMLSSRMAYGRRPDGFGLKETDALHPDGPYGQRKAEAERALAGIVDPARLTILRVANIFGNEIGRRSFFGMMMGSLAREGVIRFDMAPESLRDFFSVQDFAAALTKIAAAPQPGIFNLGSGFGTACGEIAHALIEGFGAGRLEAEGPANDQFWLDMTRTRAIYGLQVIDAARVRENCRMLGRMLVS
jgi:nucleoside-diphosphate-sugar epimerase